MMPNPPQSAQSQSDVDAEKRSALRRMQSEYLISEQDCQKKRRRADDLALEVRRLEMERDRLEVRLSEKREEQEKVSRELQLLEAEGKRLKRKMNMLS